MQSVVQYLASCYLATALSSATLYFLYVITLMMSLVLHEVCNALCLATTLKNGGNVLIPCSPSGVIYDLFECLSSHLDNCGLSLVPMYFISPVADSSLAYSNIYAEW